ncbi:lipoate--protein ligase family protein [Sporolactobacillus inulinus]|jgi:lipoate-protein ligase A|uniref:Lipoate-protein ligase A n=2 Tax=Sporolactobacillus inulinus TaxID=2078 RepID=A0A4Y3T5Q4_9BACL|nr:biotin/lipoate A/B protein ligase family protein [Sporolactobacillus inulinus]KLI01555.1 octanoyltransferase [Sporolactobacillus inulinus CASD]GAY77084.1 lipoate-protein ligase A [Sporolactobacillus inulinus]GEB76803.1 octanoyltransferase LipM [Sporolactobacillus inulinus]
MSKQEWYFIDSGIHSPAYNMALDEYLLECGEKGRTKPVLRFYGWDPPGLSIGYFQKTTGRIDFDGATAHGIACVRRLTGGLAVLHDDELTYSVVIPEDYPDMPHSVVGAYRVLSRGLLEGFRALGLDADLAIPEDKRVGAHSPVCFEEASWYELIVAGRKAAGSAQTRQRGMILQHGSIPIRVNTDQLFDCFSYANPRLKERAKRAFTGKAAALEELLGRKVALEEVKTAFYHGFEKGLNINLRQLVLTDEEEQMVRERAKNKYETDAWNRSR